MPFFHKKLTKVIGELEQGKFDDAQSDINHHLGESQTDLQREEQTFSALINAAQSYSNNLGGALREIRGHDAAQAKLNVENAIKVGQRIQGLVHKLIKLGMKESSDTK
jgi:hypothetical protein